jgi:membrane protease YdiL (CAAX protease family)
MTTVVGTSPSPGRVITVVRRAPLVSFLVLSCLLSWWPAVLYAAGASPVPIAGFGPFLAALIVLGMTTGRTGITRLLRSMVRWRVPSHVYLAAIGLPLLASGTAILANLALGAAQPIEADVALWWNVPFTMLAVLLIPGIGGAWEEPGWRGFALARFEERFGLLAGPLALGVFWVFWHGPLFLVGQILWTDALQVVAVSVVIAAVFHSARESVLIVMLMHATNNAIGGGFASELFHGSDNVSLGWLTAAIWWLMAAAVLIRAWWSRRAGNLRSE